MYGHVTEGSPDEDGPHAAGGREQETRGLILAYCVVIALNSMI
jgi:hypothetical protein